VVFVNLQVIVEKIFHGLLAILQMMDFYPDNLFFYSPDSQFGVIWIVLDKNHF
jgi:hypothetical protein